MKRFANLSEFSDNEMVSAISRAVLGVADLVAPAVEQATPKDISLLKTRFQQYICMLRAMHLWFHGAHHCVGGTGFAGDHVNLYGKIYSEIEDSVDSAIEKAVGLTNCEEMACPVAISAGVCKVLGKYPSPVNLGNLAIASTGLQIERDYQEMAECMFKELEDAGQLPLGLNDFLAAAANAHDTYVYLLQQRVKQEIGE